MQTANDSTCVKISWTHFVVS